MPVLRNVKHEAFAQALAKGEAVADAMRAAGYTDPSNSSRLTKNDEIMKRVAEIQSRVSEKAEWSAADRLLVLKRIMEANETADPRVSVSAISEANKMQGSHAPAKHQHQGPKGGPVLIADVARLKGMTEQELDILERALAQIGAVESDPGGEAEAEG